MFDYLVIGGGICGASVAYFLKQHTNNIAIIDKSGIGYGGSGAACAYVTPKIGKDSYLKTFTNQAYHFSLNFFKENTAEFFSQQGLLHLPKSEKEAKLFQNYKTFSNVAFDEPSQEQLRKLHPKKEYQDAFFFADTALVDAFGVCNSLAEDVKLLRENITSIERKEGFWQVGAHKCKRLVLATGAYSNLLAEEHIEVRAIWGQRIEARVARELNFNIHKDISVSAVNENGVFTIGATHHRDFGNVNELLKHVGQSDRETLIEAAKEILFLPELKVLTNYTGIRAASTDFLPLLGKVVDAKKTLEAFPYLVHGTKVSSERFSYYDDLYVMNGVGGRGFVLAPYLAKLLVDELENNQTYEHNLRPVRFFNRWVKKINRRSVS